VKPPAFQFYAKDFLSSPTVRLMSLEAEGAYIHLLATAWDGTPVGTLPTELEDLRLLCRASKSQWKRIWPQLVALFPVRKNRRVNDRLLCSAHAYKRFVKQQKVKGKAGASARWDNKIDGSGHAPAILKDSLQSATASANLNTTPPPPAIAGANSGVVVWRGETIIVDMGRHRRIPKLGDAFAGARAETVVDFLTRRGFPSRIVNSQ
jgi:uncharacterized protein YdaU (DUF1376 family)